MIVDFHTHVFPPDAVAEREKHLATDSLFREMYGSPRASLATADDLLLSMGRARIDVSIILGFTWSDLDQCRRHNDYLLEAAQRSGGRLVPFCIPPLATDEASLAAEVQRCARAGARGLGEIRPSGDDPDLGGPAGNALGRLARENGLVLLFHVSEPVGHVYPGKAGLSLAAFARFVSRWPDVPMVGAHWGGGLPFFALMPEIGASLGNTYFDTAASSLLYSPGIYRLAAETAGVERILFGSDFPLLSQAKNRERVARSGLTEEQVAAVLGGNARRVLHL